MPRIRKPKRKPRPAPRDPGAKRWPSRLLALGLGLVAALGLGELALRLGGFEYQLRVTVIKAAAPDPDQILEHFEIDPELIWVPGDYRRTLAEALAQRPAVAFMGDSCTHLGRYHAYLMTALARSVGRASLPYVNLGVAGWTSVQGLAQMRRDVARLRPRIATIYYGWNDHWLSIGVEDRETARIAALPLFRFQRSRLIQLLLKGYVAQRARKAAPRPLRVPLKSFRATLVELVETARALQIVPVLLTAPSGHEPGHEPEYLRGRWVEDLDELIPLHRRYVDTVREVAAASGAPLCDLAAAFDREPASDRRRRYFLPDGIHLSDQGDRRMAFFLYRCFADQGLIDLLREP